MKILLAADIFPPQVGGPATYVVTLANEFTKLGDDVRVVSLNSNSDKSMINCSLSAVRFNNKFLKYLHYFWLLLKNIIATDVVYAMGPVNAGFPSMLLAKLFRKTFVVKVVGDYAWEQYMNLESKVNDSKFVSIDDFQKKNIALPFKIKFLKWVEHFVCKQANTVIVPSEYLKKIVKNWGANRHCIEVVYNTAEFKKNLPKKVERDNSIIFVGRLVPWKGVDTLIKVFRGVNKEMPETTLKIVGDGPEMKNLKKLTANLQIEKKVKFFGNVGHEEVLKEMKKSSVFVLNSSYEGLSHVLLEAIFADLPVLASDVGGNSELIIKGGNGELFAYNNEKEMEEKIIKMISKNNLDWSEKEKDDFFEKFALTKMVEDTKKVITNLCRS